MLVRLAFPRGSDLARIRWKAQQMSNDIPTGFNLIPRDYRRGVLQLFSFACLRVVTELTVV